MRSLNMSQLGAGADRLRSLTRRLPPWWCGTPIRPPIAPDQEAVTARAFAREDLFTVVLEQFMTDTARHADVVFPATTQLEHLDVVGSDGVITT